jgi:hypothetical protein
MKLALKYIEKSLSGLGSEDAIEGLKSGNLLEMEDGIYQSPLYIIVDHFNISSTLVFP